MIPQALCDLFSLVNDALILSQLSPQLSAFQGPGIYFYNDSVFSQDDLNHLSKVPGISFSQTFASKKIKWKDRPKLETGRAIENWPIWARLQQRVPLHRPSQFCQVVFFTLAFLMVAICRQRRLSDYAGPSHEVSARDHLQSARAQNSVHID